MSALVPVIDLTPWFEGEAGDRAAVAQQVDQAHTWADAPYDPAALAVNIGDLLARWTGDRWRSTRHRVLAPAAGSTRRGPALTDLLL